MNAHSLFRIPIILAIALGLAAPAGFTALAEAPPNDDITNATVVDSLPFSATFDLTEATASSSDPWTDCDWYGPQRTVWFKFSPANDLVFKASLPDRSWYVTFSVFEEQNGSLVQRACAGHTNNPIILQAFYGHTYYFLINLDYDWSDYFTGTFTLEEVQPPVNDSFSKAIPINLGYSERIDFSGATIESNEPLPSCGSDLQTSVWYKFTAAASESISFRFPEWYGEPRATIYSGDDLSNLNELDCMGYEYLGTILAEEGQTYFIQVGARDRSTNSVVFELIPTPPPEIGWYWFDPGDPSVFDTVNICAQVWDPGEIGIASMNWDFGDGAKTSSLETCVSHKYTADGDYTVNFLVTTQDGRSASRSDVLKVRTHDVSITRVTAPLSASARQMRTISVDLRNTHYPEQVRVVLYKSVVGGFQEVGYLNQYVPVRTGNRTSRINFNYTFTPQDAALGKVTFKAVAELQEARDAFPADNEAISTPPTKVSGRLAPASPETISPQ